MLKILFVLSLVCSSTLQAAESILVFGDSLSAAYGLESDQHGWVGLLQQQLQQQKEPAVVINASLSGETSRGGAQRLGKLLEIHQPTVVILELGANDGLRGFPPKQMKANLQQMIDQSKATGAKVLLLGMRAPRNYGKRYIELFDQVFPQLAQENDIALVPFLLDDVVFNKDMIQHDGLHPNAKAQPVMMKVVLDQLRLM